RRYDAHISYAKRTGWVYDPVKQKLTYTYGAETEVSAAAVNAAPEQRLSAGRHEMALKVDDWKGNSTELTWSFIADPSLPKPAAIAKEERQKRQQQSPNMRGGGGGMGRPGGGGGYGGSGGGFGRPGGG